MSLTFIVVFGSVFIVVLWILRRIKKSIQHVDQIANGVEQILNLMKGKVNENTSKNSKGEVANKQSGCV